MVNGETYRYVKSLCYLGDTLDGAGLAVTARIRNGWIISKSFCHFGWR